MKNFNKKNFLKILPVLVFLTFSITFHYFSPDYIVNWIGEENSYLLIFVLALIGGLSTFSGVPYHVFLVGLALGGLNPYILGLVTATGVMLGDTTSYFLGYYGRVLITPGIESSLEKILHLEEKHPALLPIIFLIYGSALPFSNDIVTIPSGLIRYPFFKVMIPLAIGNLIFNTLLALYSIQAYSLIENFL